VISALVALSTIWTAEIAEDGVGALGGRGGGQRRRRGTHGGGEAGERGA
jgi:hypothetical protein